MFPFRSLEGLAQALSFFIVREEMARLLMSLANEQHISRPARDCRFFLFRHESKRRDWGKQERRKVVWLSKFVCTEGWWNLAMASWNERRGALVHWDWGNYVEKVISIGDKPISYPLKNHERCWFNSGTRCFALPPKITVYRKTCRYFVRCIKRRAYVLCHNEFQFIHFHFC